jgi:hypothetical protein
MLTVKEAFKVGFLARCVEDNLRPEQILERVKIASELIEKQGFPFIGAAAGVGAGVGALRAGKGNRAQGAGRGALQGLGAGVGGTLGSLAGLIASHGSLGAGLAGTGIGGVLGQQLVRHLQGPAHYGEEHLTPAEFNNIPAGLRPSSVTGDHDADGNLASSHPGPYLTHKDLSAIAPGWLPKHLQHRGEKKAFFIPGPGTAIGTVGGAINAGKGNRAQGAGRGALQGLGWDAGGVVGGNVGLLGGAGLGIAAGNAMQDPQAAAVLGLLGGGVGGLSGYVGGGLLGRHLTRRWQGPAAYAKPDEAEKTAFPGEQTLGKVIDTGKDIGSGLLHYGVPAALIAPPVLGGLAGYGLAKATDVDDTDVTAIKNQELVDEYMRQSDRLKRQTAARNYRTDTRRAGSMFF